MNCGPRVLALLAPLVLLAGTPSAAQDGRPAARQQDAFTETVVVRRVLLDVRVIDASGQPVTGLGPADFRVEIDGEPIERLTVDWLDEEAPAAAPSTPAPVADGAGPVPAPPPAPPGRLIVLFFQRDLEPSRAAGLIRMAVLLHDAIPRLRPADRVAVLSFDSRLDFHLDFTGDHDRLLRVIDEVGVPIARPRGPLPFQPAPSLGRSFDYDAAREAATIEDALVVTGKALERLPGPKTMYFFAFGMGRFTAAGVYTGKEFDAAVDALNRARVSAFTFDVVDADWHSLEGPLRTVAKDTGGMFQKVDAFARNALDRAGRAIAGHYVLAFAAPDLPPGRHDVRVRLAGGRRGEVLAQQTWEN